jgi:hypothetical protein
VAAPPVPDEHVRLHQNTFVWKYAGGASTLHARVVHTKGPLSRRRGEGVVASLCAMEIYAPQTAASAKQAAITAVLSAGARA